MAVAKPRNPLVPIITPTGEEIYVHPVDAIEITRNGLGKYKDVNQAPPRVREELQRIEKQVASAVTPAPEKVEEAPQKEASEPAVEPETTEEETTAAPKLRRRQATAGTREG